MNNLSIEVGDFVTFKIGDRKGRAEVLSIRGDWVKLDIAHGAVHRTHSPATGRKRLVTHKSHTTGRRSK